MQPGRRTRRLVVAGLVVVALVSAACTASSSAPATIAAGPLLTITTRGGLCPDGPCGSTVTLERDGRVHVAAKPPNDLGRVPQADLAALDAAIRATDFAALRSHPFRSECPTAYDGQEVIFEFATPDGVERISTCEVEVDFGSPLFVAASKALGSFVPLPAR